MPVPIHCQYPQGMMSVPLWKGDGGGSLHILSPGSCNFLQSQSQGLYPGDTDDRNPVKESLLIQNPKRRAAFAVGVEARHGEIAGAGDADSAGELGRGIALGVTVEEGEIGPGSK